MAQAAPDTLPADFQGWDAAPDTLPKDFNGWDQQESAKPQAPEPGFMERFNSRMGANVRALADLPGTIHSMVGEIQKRQAEPYEPGKGLREIADYLQKTYSDPANIAADALTAFMAGEAGSEPGETPKAAEAAKPAGEGVASKLGEAIQSRARNAAVKYLLKRIPGAHATLDLRDLYNDVFGGEAEAPKTPTPQVPPQWGKGGPGAGPVDMWGKRITPEQPVTPPTPEPQQPAWTPPAPQIRRQPEPVTRAEHLDDQMVEDAIRARAASEEHQMLYEGSRERFAGSNPSTPKSTLIEQAGGTVPQKPVKFTKTPGVNYPPLQPWEKTGADLGDVYHGSQAKVSEIDPAKLQQRDAGFYGKGFYVTDSPEYAKTYGPKITKAQIAPDARVLDVGTIHPGYEQKVNPGLQSAIDANERQYLSALPKAKANPSLVDNYAELIDPSSKNFDLNSWIAAVNRYAENKGYDVVRFSPGETIVKNPAVLQTRVSAGKASVPAGTSVPQTADESVALMKKMLKQAKTKGRLSDLR